jgi:hypothetical protein
VLPGPTHPRPDLGVVEYKCVIDFVPFYRQCWKFCDFKARVREEEGNEIQDESVGKTQIRV